MAVLCESKLDSVISYIWINIEGKFLNSYYNIIQQSSKMHAAHRQSFSNRFPGMLIQEP